MGKTVGVTLALKDKCSPQLKKISEVMGVTVKEAKRLQKEAQGVAKELGAGMKTAVVTCTAAVGAMAIATQQLVMNTVQAGDRVDKLSQKIGLSRAGFQEWDYIMAQNGANIESLQMGMKTLVNQIDGVNKGNKNAINNFSSLGVSIKDSTGKLKNQEQIFEEVVTALQKMPDGAKKAKLANDLFGRSGSELMPVLQGTAKGVEDLKKRYKELGMGISDEAVDSCVLFGDTLDDIKKSFAGFGASIGAEFLPILQRLADNFITNMPKIKQSVMPVVNGMIGALNFLANNMELIIAVTSGVVSAFATFHTISTAIKIISTLQKVIQFVTAAQGIWNAVMIANPIGAIAMGVGLLITGIVLLVRNWDKVTEAVKKAIEAVKKFLGFKPKKKTIEVETVQTTSTKEKPKKHALGVGYSTGGPAIVGEYGPEILNLKKGDSITSTGKSKQILQGNKEIKIEVNIAGNVIGNNEFIQQLKNVLALELKTALATV